jgi:hypothetical protein
MQAVPAEADWKHSEKRKQKQSEGEGELDVRGGEVLVPLGLARRRVLVRYSRNEELEALE